MTFSYAGAADNLTPVERQPEEVQSIIPIEQQTNMDIYVMNGGGIIILCLFDIDWRVNNIVIVCLCIDL